MDEKFWAAVKKNYQDGLSNAAGITKQPQSAQITKAYAYIEARMSVKYDVLVQEFIACVEDGTAVYRLPDPTKELSLSGKKLLTTEVVDKLIEETISAFQDGQNFTGKEQLPLLRELPPHAKMAFGQEAYELLMTDAQILAQAEKRVSRGERFPPPQVFSQGE